MYPEQNDYYYLMQKCLDHTNRLFIINRIISKLYRFFSSYGQSTVKPIFWLILVWVISAAFYSILIPSAYGIGENKMISEGFLLSAQQIVKPYNILFDDSKGMIIHILGFFESSLSITLITLFILALRWNFRKN